MTYSLRLLPLLLLPTLALPGCVVHLDGDLDDLAPGCWGDAQPRVERSVIDEPITAVVLEDGVGDVTVRAHAEPGAIVEARLYAKDDGGPQTHIHVDDGVMHVSVDCGRLSCCGADLDLAIPADATVEIELGVGDVNVADLTGTVTVDVGTGDIDLARLGGGLGLHTGTGSIDGRSLHGASAWADVGTGDISLSWSEDAPVDAIDLDVGVGRVDLTVPQGTYDLHLDTGVGDVDVSGLDDDGSASRRIAVDVGTGDIDVRGR